MIQVYPIYLIILYIILKYQELFPKIQFNLLLNQLK
jgi:hypothetical protein